MAKASKGARTKKRGRAAHRKRNLIILCFEIVAVIVLAIVLRMIIMPASRMGKIDLNDTLLKSQMNEGVQDVAHLKEYETIALFGVDSRQGELAKATLSDVIMLASINKSTGDIRLCSVYRDTYLDLGDGDYGKATAAYSLGGPEKALNMLNRNLDLNVTDFVTIGFQGLTDVIDALGGIEIDVQEEAVQHMNNYQWTMAQERYGLSSLEETIAGVHYTPVQNGGWQTLNGLQATAYCRVRYISGSDLARAQHQREVLEATLAKAKKASLPQLTRIAEAVFDETYTSMALTEIVAHLPNLPKYNMVSQAGFPSQDMLSFGTIPGSYAGSSVIATDLQNNVIYLHNQLYGVENYEPTQQVKTRNEDLINRTYPYIGQ